MQGFTPVNPPLPQAISFCAAFYERWLPKCGPQVWRLAVAENACDSRDFFVKQLLNVDAPGERLGALNRPGL